MFIDMLNFAISNLSGGRAIILKFATPNSSCNFDTNSSVPVAVSANIGHSMQAITDLHLV